MPGGDDISLMGEASELNSELSAHAQADVAMAIAEMDVSDDVSNMEATPMPKNIWEAVQDNDLAAVETFIAEGGNLEVMQGDLNETPLLSAARYGSFAVAEKLLEAAGANINARNSDGQSALILATISNHTEMVKLLVKNKADVNIQDNTGSNALSYAEHAQNHAITNLLKAPRTVKLIDRSDLNHKFVSDLPPLPPPAPIFDAIAKGDLSRIQDLVAGGANLESKAYRNQETPLISAARGRHHNTDEGKQLEIVNFLLAKGAKVNARDNKGNTALMSASIFNKIDVIKSLVAAGAEINAQNNQGDTALMEVSSGLHHKATIETLLDNGADMHILNNQRRNPLMEASGWSSHRPIFIAHQAKIDQLATFIKSEFVDKPKPDVKREGYKFFEAYQRLSKNDLKVSCQHLGIANVDRVFAKVDQHIAKHATEISLVAKHPYGQFIDKTGRRVTIPEDVMKHVFSYLTLPDINSSKQEPINKKRPLEPEKFYSDKSSKLLR